MPATDRPRKVRRLEAVFARPRLLLIASLLVASLAALGLPRLEVDNAPHAFFVRDARLLSSLEELEGLFGGRPAVRMAWSGDGLWTEAGVRWLERATREARALDGVAAVSGPLELGNWWVPPESPSEVERRLREDLLALAGGWVSSDGRMASVLVELENGLSGAERARAVDALGEMSRSAPPGIDGVVVGLPIIERAMNRSFARLMLRIFPAIGLVCALVLALACRDPVDALLPLGAVAVVEATLLGAMGWAGVRLNLITSILLPIVFVLGLAIGTHLQMTFRRHRQRGIPAVSAARAALRERAWAVFWAGTTTAAAFGSFGFSRVAPVRELGLWTATGVGLIVIGALAFQAPAMALFGGGASRGRRYDRFARRLGERLAGQAGRRRGVTIVALGLVGALAAAGLPRLEVETGLLNYFPPGHPVRTAFEAVADGGVGAAPAELVLRLRQADPEASFRDPDRLERLADLGAAVRAEARIFQAVGAGDLFRAAGRRAIEGGPRDGRMRWLVLGLLQTDPEASRRLDQLVTADGRAARVTLLLPVTGYEALLPVLERAVEAARSAFPEAEVEWTGHYPLVLVAQRDLLATMAVSLGLTVLAVTLVFALLLRSPSRWAAATAVNLWPLLVTAGLMGWIGIPLDSTTVMIAAVALGIAVDDTLHTLGELRLAPGGVAQAIGGVAPAELLTTAILALGFAGCGLADFLPIARFGLLTATALVAALVGDWLLLPALLERPRTVPRGR